MEKYTKAIELMNAVDVNGDNVCKQWDDLFTFLHTNFPIPAASKKAKPDLTYKDIAELITDEDRAYISECTHLLKVDKVDDVLEKITKLPPDYSDVLFPVAIARYLLAYKGVRFLINQLTTFSEFHDRYSVMVIESV